MADHFGRKAVAGVTSGVDRSHAAQIT
jgi:hypothetical protein